MGTYGHLSVEERMLIYRWQREGVFQAEMGWRLGRNRATISREISRSAVAAGYLPDLAQRRYQARRQRSRRRPPAAEPPPAPDHPHVLAAGSIAGADLWPVAG